MVSWADSTHRPKRQLDRLSHFCTIHDRPAEVPAATKPVATDNRCRYVADDAMRLIIIEHFVLRGRR